MLKYFKIYFIDRVSKKAVYYCFSTGSFKPDWFILVNKLYDCYDRSEIIMVNTSVLFKQACSQLVFKPTHSLTHSHTHTPPSVLWGAKLPGVIPP